MKSVAARARKLKAGNNQAGRAMLAVAYAKDFTILLKPANLWLTYRWIPTFF